MQRIPPTTLLMILAVIGLMFGWCVNRADPIIEVVVDNTHQLEQATLPAAPPPVEMNGEVNDPCGQWSRFTNDANCPPVTTPAPDYPVPYDDGDIQWDGQKVPGWDDGAPEWPAPSNTAGADHNYDDPRPDWLKNGD